MNYNETLKELRIKANLTQEKIAEKLEINRVQYNQYENDYNTIPIKHLNSVANFFQVSIDYILGLNKNSKYNLEDEMIDNLKAGKRLKEFRKNNKITQEKLAKKLNTTQSVIANYERGRTIIATPFLYAICKEYKISADYLLGKIENNPLSKNEG